MLLGLLILMNLILSILVEGHIKARGLIYDQEDLPTIREKVVEELLTRTPVGKVVKAVSPRLYAAMSPEKEKEEEEEGAGRKQSDGSDRVLTVSARAARRGARQ